MSKFTISNETVTHVTAAMATAKGVASFLVGAVKSNQEGKLTTFVRVIGEGTQITYAFYVESDEECLEGTPLASFSVDAQAFVSIVNTFASYGESIAIECKEDSSKISIQSAQSVIELDIVAPEKIPMPLPEDGVKNAFASIEITIKDFMAMLRKGAALSNEDDSTEVGKLKSFTLVGNNKLVGKSTNLKALERASCTVKAMYQLPVYADALLQEKIAAFASSEQAKALSEKKDACKEPEELVSLAKAEGCDLDTLDFCLNLSGLNFLKAILSLDGSQTARMLVSKNYLYVQSTSCTAILTLGSKLATNVYASMEKYLQGDALTVTLDVSRFLNDIGVLALVNENNLPTCIRFSKDGLILTRGGAKAITPISQIEHEADTMIFLDNNQLKGIISSLDKGNMVIRCMGDAHPIIFRNGDLKTGWDDCAFLLPVRNVNE